MKTEKTYEEKTKIKREALMKLDEMVKGATKFFCDTNIEMKLSEIKKFIDENRFTEDELHEIKPSIERIKDSIKNFLFYCDSRGL